MLEELSKQKREFSAYLGELHEQGNLSQIEIELDTFRDAYIVGYVPQFEVLARYDYTVAKSDDLERKTTEGLK